MTARLAPIQTGAIRCTPTSITELRHVEAGVVVFAVHRQEPRQHPNCARMYEADSWYTAFVPRTAKPQEKGKHRRRESLLKQENVSPPSAAGYV